MLPSRKRARTAFEEPIYNESSSDDSDFDFDYDDDDEDNDEDEVNVKNNGTKITLESVEKYIKKYKLDESNAAYDNLINTYPKKHRELNDLFIKFIVSSGISFSQATTPAMMRLVELTSIHKGYKLPSKKMLVKLVFDLRDEVKRHQTKQTQR